MHFSSNFIASIFKRANCSHHLLRSSLQLVNYSTITGVAGRKSSSSNKLKNFDILGTWDSSRELPLELESSISYGTPIPKILTEAIGSHTMQGRRPYNEDRFVIKELRPNLLYFAVFDGHGGINSTAIISSILLT